MGWTLLGKAKRYIENSLIARTLACNARANVELSERYVDSPGGSAARSKAIHKMVNKAPCQYGDLVTSFVTI